MRDFIKAQRKLGQRIAMILSVDHSSTPKRCQCDSCIQDFTYSWDKINTKLHIGPAAKFKVPWQSEESLKTEEQGDEREKSRIKDSNVRNLKMSLRSEFPRNMQVICLEKDAVWDFPADGKALEFMSSRHLSDDEVQKATRQILGRSWQKETVDTEDIIVVLARIFDQRVTHRDGENEDTEAKKDEKSAWELRKDAIHDDCNKFEQKLLSGVVDPGISVLLF
jgi:hypothetical protein